jgi:hypothetical protein
MRSRPARPDNDGSVTTGWRPVTVPDSIGLGNGTVILTGAAIIHTWKALAWVIRQARSDDNIVASRVLALERVLAAEAACVAARGQQDAPEPQALQAVPDDVIDTNQAAALLGVSVRTVRRRTDELGGRQVAGRWMFDRLLVTAAAQKGPTDATT